MKRIVFLVGAACAVAAGSARVPAQNRMAYSVVSADSGHVALGLAIRKLAVSGAFMQAPAHPDDETNSLFAMFAHGMGLRSIDLQNNRGDGGQNEMGPELSRDIGVLRTAELLAAHRIDGAEQYFTRAIDYGYSFDPEEVINKWGRDAVIGDYVRLIRALRPDVVVTMNIQGRGGDRAHEATTILAREAYRAAGDPNRYPEQIADGLRAWQPKKLYFAAGFGGGRGPGGGGGQLQYQLVDSTIPGQMQKDESGLFDGVDISLAGIAQFDGANPPDALTSGLAAIVDHAANAKRAFDSGDDAATAPPIEAGVPAIRALRAGLASMRLSDATRYEIDFRLRNKERDYQDAVLAAHGLTFDAVADDGLVVSGQPVRLSLVAVNRGAVDVDVASVAIAGLDASTGSGPTMAPACAAGIVKKDAVFTCSADARVPQGAKATTPYFTDEYWSHPSTPAINRFEPGVPFGVPFVPTPFRVTFHVKAGSADVAKEIPIQYRYVRDIYNGDKRMELNVVPAFSVKVTPPLEVIPAPAASATAPV